MPEPSKYKFPAACNEGAAAMSKPEMVSNIEAIGPAMGMSTPCVANSVEYVNNVLETDKSSFAMGGAMAGFGMVGGFAGGGSSSYSRDEQTFVDSMQKSGCGDFMASTTNVMNKAIDIKCKLNNVSQTSTTISRGTASIEIVALSTVDWQNELNNLIDKAGSIPPESLEILSDLYREKLKLAANSGNLSIRNGTLTASVQSEVKVIGTLSVQDRENVVSDMRDMTTAMVANEVSKNLTNVGETADNVRRITEKLEQDIRTSVDVVADEVLVDAVSKQSGTSAIVLKGNNIDLENVVLTSDSNLDLIVENVIEKCGETAQTIVREKYLELSEMNKEDVVQMGPDMVALMDNFGKNNAQSRKNEADGHSSSIKALGGMLGGIFSSLMSFGMLFYLLPLVAGVAVFKFVDDPFLKKVLVGGIVLMLALSFIGSSLMMLAGLAVLAVVAYYKFSKRNEVGKGGERAGTPSYMRRAR